MRRRVKSLYGYSLKAKDGEGGHIHDFLFDDNTWQIKYVVVKAGHSILGIGNVLISPHILDHEDYAKRTFDICRTVADIKNSPEEDSVRTVSRQHFDELYADSAGWLASLGGGGLIPVPLIPPPIAEEEQREISLLRERIDPHLHSMREVSGYRIRTTDNMTAHVHDIIVDIKRWQIRLFVVDTRRWLPGRRIVLPAHFIDAIQWEENTIHVALTGKALKNHPLSDRAIPAPGQRRGTGDRAQASKNENP